MQASILLLSSLIAAPTSSPFILDASSRKVGAHGVDFAERFETVSGTSLRLSSTGLMRYKRVLRGFVAALYLEDPKHRSDVLADIPKRLELSYFWKVPGKMFGRAGRDALKKGLRRQEIAALEDRLKQIDAAFRDIVPGDHYALTYLPGQGTELSLNGKALTTIPGADFARAYFSIWLGRSSIDRSLRNQLLAR